MILKKIKSNSGDVAGMVIIFFICLVLFLQLVIRCVDFFQPINRYYDMKEICKYNLYTMSLTGGLNSTERTALKTKLEGAGLKNVNIIYPAIDAAKVKFGEDVRLRVEAEFSYSTITAYLTRTTVTERFVYDKTQVQKKLDN